MYQYSNTFTSSIDDKKTTVLLSFRQSYPKVENNGTVNSTETSEIANIVLDRNGFEAFRDLINQIEI